VGKASGMLTIACQGLRARPAESLLLLFLFTVIFCAALTSVCLVRSARRAIENTLDRLGKDIIQVHPSLTLAQLFGPFREKLTLGDVRLLSRAAGGPAVGIRLTAALAGADSTKADTVVVETTEGFPEVNNAELLNGRFFKKNEHHLCVLDRALAEELFGTTSATGRSIELKAGKTEKTFKVVGVLDDPLGLRRRLRSLDVLSGARPLVARVLEARNVYVPFGSLGHGQALSLCLVRHSAELTPKEASERIRAALGERAGRMTVWARGPWIDKIKEVLQIGYLFSNLVWGFFVALIEAMIVTLALLAVSGRKTEFGVRRVEGATRPAVAVQVLLEGILLGASGAALGFLAAPSVGAWLCRNLPWHMRIEPGEVVFVFSVGMILLLLSFLIPAIRASTLEPAEAVRDL